MAVFTYIRTQFVYPRATIVGIHSVRSQEDDIAKKQRIDSIGGDGYIVLKGINVFGFVSNYVLHNCRARV